MSPSCDIVKDLVVLYKDDCIHENTKRSVREHLNACKSCRKYYNNYETGYSDDRTFRKCDEPKYDGVKSYSEVAKRLRIKGILRDVMFSASAVVSVFIVLTVARAILNKKNRF